MTVTRPFDPEQFVGILNCFVCSGFTVDFHVDDGSDDVLVDLVGMICGPMGTEPGYASRTLHLDDSLVWHNALPLDAADQRKGFGKAFEQYSINLYKQYGFTRVCVNAKEVGGYVWQSCGYRLKGEDLSARSKQSLDIWGAHGGRARAQEAVRRNEATAADFEALDAAFEALGSGGRDPLEPSEIAQFGTDYRSSQRPEMWLGKAVLLDSRWVGYKDI
jgi:GNAT superfamily N-acetyltransferase